MVAIACEKEETPVTYKVKYVVYADTAGMEISYIDFTGARPTVEMTSTHWEKELDAKFDEKPYLRVFENDDTVYRNVSAAIYINGVLSKQKFGEGYAFQVLLQDTVN